LIKVAGKYLAACLLIIEILLEKTDQGVPHTNKKAALIKITGPDLAAHLSIREENIPRRNPLLHHTDRKTQLIKGTDPEASLPIRKTQQLKN
jgi:hypothetical protein